MYPKHFLDYFCDFEVEDEVFVAMPFDGTERRWMQIFVPAIEAVDLEPYRVDERQVGDSILTDILDGVCRARLVLGDVSGDGVYQVDGTSVSRPNPNVVYEVGVAHAARLPEEVVVVREESEGQLPFDLSTIRYQTFDPTDAGAAADFVAGLLRHALDEIDRSRDLIVEKTLRAVDDDSAHLIRDHYENGYFNPWIEEQEGAPMQRYRRFVIPRLLDLGVLRAETYQEYGTQKYYFTELGRLVGERLPGPDGRIVGE